MTFLPGKYLVRAATLLALASAGMMLWPAWGMLLLAAMAVLLLAAAWDALRTWRLASKVLPELEAPQSVVRGRTILARLSVCSHAGTPLVARVRPVLPEQGRPCLWDREAVLAPHADWQEEISIAADVRGAYDFGGIWLRIASPWQLVQVQRHFDVRHTCKVLPDVERVKEYLVSRRLRILGNPVVRTAALRGLGDTFESLRDYEQGDDVRRIDWRATARQGRLISRNYEIEPDRDVMILVDRGRLMGAVTGGASKFDHALDAGLMLCAVALDSGDRCGFMVFDRDVELFLPPQSSISRLPAIVAAIASIQPVAVESHFLRPFARLQARLAKRSLIVIVSDIIDTMVSRSMVEAMLALSKRHLVILAALRTPEIHTLLANTELDGIAPGRKAAAYRLRRERQEVIGQLRKGGVLVIDVSPDALTAPLINQYIEVREKNRL